MTTNKKQKNITFSRTKRFFLKPMVFKRNHAPMFAIKWLWLKIQIRNI